MQIFYYYLCDKALTRKRFLILSNTNTYSWSKKRVCIKNIISFVTKLFFYPIQADKGF